MISNQKVDILDCTLRDGGYYLNWDFKTDLVQKYLNAINTCRIEIVEIGFRTFAKGDYYGPYAFSTDNFLRKLNIPSNIKLAVMLNASDVIHRNNDINLTIDSIFLPRERSQVEIVRIAFVAQDSNKTIEIADYLSKLGYRVFVNLMQVDLISQDLIEETISKFSKVSSVECFYIADSFGNLDSKKIKEITGTIRKFWTGSLGFHAHDNKGLAFSNSLSAIELGFDYIDGTITGMGRGAGNAKTEHLAIELADKNDGKYFPDALFQLVSSDFSKLKEKYNWGSNIFYHLSALNGIHPTYVQQLVGESRYDSDHILSAIKFLRSEKAPVYSFERLTRAISGISSSKPGEWDASDFLVNQDVLIIGPGPKLKYYIDEIHETVLQKKLKVLCLNTNVLIEKEIVEAYVTCHEMRILIEADEYARLDKKLIMPKAKIPSFLKETLQYQEILDYGLEVTEGAFDIRSNGCSLESSLSLGYAIAVATAGGAKRILVAGIDGYNKSDSRFDEVEMMLKRYAANPMAVPIISITPTLYSIEKNSIFNPELFCREINNE